jgi:hypothetical protein
MPRSQRAAPLLAEDRHLLPRCPLLERLHFSAPSTNAETRWREPKPSELLGLITRGDDSLGETANFTLFSMPPGLRRRFATLWQRQANGAAEDNDTGLVDDLVHWLAFVDAPVRGTCSVHIHLVDTEGLRLGPASKSGYRNALALINVGDAPAALIIDVAESAGAPGPALRVALESGEGVFLRGRAPAFELAAVMEKVLILSVLPHA